MPEQQEQFQNAVWQVLEAVMFENWLRFYFISEKPDAPAGPAPTTTTSARRSPSSTSAPSRRVRVTL